MGSSLLWCGVITAPKRAVPCAENSPHKEAVVSLKDRTRLAKVVAAAAVALAAAGGAVNTGPNLPNTACNQTVQVS